MSREISKKSQSPKRHERVQKKKNAHHSDSDTESQSYSDSDIDSHELRKCLHKHFPSKHLAKKIKAGDRLHKVLSKSKHSKVHPHTYSSEEEDDDSWETESESTLTSEEEDEEEEEELPSPKKRKSKKHSKKEESSESDVSDKKTKTKAKATNIIFTIGGVGRDNEWEDYDDDDDEYDEDYEEEDEEEEDEDEDVSVSSDEEEDEDEDDEDEEEEEVKDDSSHPVLKELRALLEKNPSDKNIRQCVEMYQANIRREKKRKEKKEKKQKAKNMRIFRKVMSDKNVMNDYTFYEKLECESQKKLIKDLREINKALHVEKPYRMTLLDADIPVNLKAIAFKKVNALRYMDPSSSEYYKIKNWVDTFMKIPFNRYETLSISIDDGVEKCHDFMENALKVLNEAVYGLNDAKMQIMQMLGQLLINPTSIGSAIAIHGPPGTGKTSLVKEGISKILNRPFTFIALGGATDSSFLEGHGYTYEGSTWGKIVQVLIESKCMNPVIYFDELDKISDTPRGEEIAGILTHLTDTTQNSQFHDKYFSEVNFDLSKCLFIFSYNDESKINPILKDRMYRIKTNGYSSKEKQVISQNYLLPKIREQVKFKDEDIIIPNEVITYINDTHCQKENGVRNLKRCLEIIYTKLNLYRLMKAGTNLFEKEMSLKVEFPFTVTRDIVDKLIKKDESDGLETWRSFYN